MTSILWRRWLRTVFGEKPASRPSSGRPRRRLLGLEAFEDRSLPSGTPTMIADINPGSAPSNPYGVVSIGSTTYFVADDGVHGRELWKSDGTATGTVMVKDINPGSVSSEPVRLTDVNGTLFFSATDGTQGTELWKSDGTAAGTVLVKDIRPGSVSLSPFELTSVNGTLFFAADDGTHHYQLWKSDGTVAGTVLVKQFNNTNYWENPGDLTDVNGTLFFRANDGNGTKLWKSAGTAASTVPVANNGPREPSELTNVNGTLYFQADATTAGFGLWKSDGTAAGTVLVKALGGWIADLTNVNGVLFFSVRDSTHGEELWKSDGTAAGTTLVKNINDADYGQTGPRGSYPSGLTSLNGVLYFSALDGGGETELWKSDGTAAGTTLVKDIYPGGTYGYDPGDGWYIPPSWWYVPNSSAPGQLTNMNGTLFFSAWDGNGNELWQSDGTAAGTVLVAGLNPGSASSSPRNLMNVSGTLFFTADDGVHGTELWVLPPGPPPPPSLTITDVSRVEGNTGAATALFTVQLSAASNETITVRYTTADGSATAGSDYQAASGVLTFAPGERTKTIPVLINGDSHVEANETFVIDLGEATNATIFDGRGIGTIVDDDPRISISDVSHSEGNTGQSAFTFTVSLSAAAGVAVTVDFTTAGVSATIGTDFQATSGRLTFAPGETTKTITVLVNGDRVAEPSETFFVNLGGSTNAIILDGQGVGTILDDEPRISISDVSVKEGKRNQKTLFTFTVSLSAAYDQPVTVSFRTTDGTARASDGDYVARNGTLTFAPGETTKTITIEVKGDSKREDYETFYVDLFNLSGNTLFGKSRGDGVILNDD